MTKETLTDRDIAIILDLARMKLLSTAQIAGLHWNSRESDGKDSKACANRLRLLKIRGFVERKYAPLTSEETKLATRPSAIWLFPATCQRKVFKQLLEQGRASDVTTIESQLITTNKDQKFAQQALLHEVGISEVILALEAKIATMPGYELVFALRTSPRHEDITKTVSFTKTIEIQEKGQKQKTPRQVTRKIPVNPDIFVCIKYPDKSYSFTWYEYDNDSSSEPRFQDKLDAYKVYANRNLFVPVAKLFAERYGILIKSIDQATFQVVTIVHSNTNQMRRRNALFAKSLDIEDDDFFNFTTLAEWQRDPMGAIMVNSDTFNPLKRDYLQMRKASPIVRNKWFDANIDALPKYSLTA